MSEHVEVAVIGGGIMGVAALYQLSQQGKLKAETVARAIGDLGIDPEKIDPLAMALSTSIAP